MTFILISGKAGAGKTAVCGRLHQLIAADLHFTVTNTQQNPVATQQDFMACYTEKGGKRIVLNSAAENDRCMAQFALYLGGLAHKPDIIVTAIRDDDAPNDQMSRMLALLEAADKGTPNLAAHYAARIMTAPVHTHFEPAALARDASVLHLGPQTAPGEEAVRPADANGAARPSAQQIAYDAETAKQMLDLAV